MLFVVRVGRNSWVFLVVLAPVWLVPSASCTPRTALVGSASCPEGSLINPIGQHRHHPRRDQTMHRRDRNGSKAPAVATEVAIVTDNKKMAIGDADGDGTASNGWLIPNEVGALFEQLESFDHLLMSLVIPHRAKLTIGEPLSIPVKLSAANRDQIARDTEYSFDEESSVLGVLDQNDVTQMNAPQRWSEELHQDDVPRNHRRGHTSGADLHRTNEYLCHGEKHDDTDDGADGKEKQRSEETRPIFGVLFSPHSDEVNDGDERQKSLDDGEPEERPHLERYGDEYS